MAKDVRLCPKHATEAPDIKKWQDIKESHKRVYPQKYAMARELYNTYEMRNFFLTHINDHYFDQCDLCAAIHSIHFIPLVYVLLRLNVLKKLIKSDLT